MTSQFIGSKSRGIIGSAVFASGLFYLLQSSLPTSLCLLFSTCPVSTGAMDSNDVIEQQLLLALWSTWAQNLAVGVSFSAAGLMAMFGRTRWRSCLALASLLFLVIWMVQISGFAAGESISERIWRYWYARPAVLIKVGDFPMLARIVIADFLIPILAIVSTAFALRFTRAKD